MRILLPSNRHTTTWLPCLATAAVAVMLAGSIRADDNIVPAAARTVATETVVAATPTATAPPAAVIEADAKEREADAAARRHAVLLLILNASGHPFGFFK